MKIKWWHIAVVVVAGIAIFAFYKQAVMIAKLEAQLNNCNKQVDTCGSDKQQLSSEIGFLREEIQTQEELLYIEHKVDKPEKYNGLGYHPERNQRG